MRHTLHASLLALAAACLAMALPAQAQQRFGTVHQLRGTVQATGLANLPGRTLRQGDSVYVGERMVAGAAGEAVLTTDDAGVIAVRPNTQFVVEQFAANGARGDGQVVRILSGALRLITGWTGLLRKDSNRVITPSATVGIRGTDHEPYVIGAQMSVDLDLPEGTYDKVFSGSTVLQSPVGEVAIAPGKVGFAPVVERVRERALLTVLMPKILESVPTFYVPGAFDAQLQALAQQKMQDAIHNGHLPQASVYEAPAEPTSPTPTTPTTPSPASAPAVPAPLPTEPAGKDQQCPAQQIASQWLSTLDGAVQARNAPAVVALFASNAHIRAQVRRSDGGKAELHFNREELARSTVQALADLQQFSTRRPVVRAQSNPGCNVVQVESITLESGVRNGAPYRLESLERYTLELQRGNWLAVQALTEQR